MSRAVLKKKPEIYIEFAVFIFVALLMLLASFNISSFLMPKKVLGINTDDAVLIQRQEFWNSYLAKNPNYIPGLIETGNTDKAKVTDPNYIMP